MTLYINLNENLHAIIQKDLVIVVDAKRKKAYAFTPTGLTELRDWWNCPVGHKGILKLGISISPRKNGYVRLGCETVRSQHIRKLYELWDSLQELR